MLFSASAKTPMFYLVQRSARLVANHTYLADSESLTLLEASK